MSKFIRCMKATGQVVGTDFDQRPDKLPHTSVFWVEVPDGSQFPQKYSNSDVVSFALTSPLTATELSARDLIKNEPEGVWQHSFTTAEAAVENNAEQVKTIDRETYRLIKDWCQNQPEGCEEAFYVFGITDINDSRYQTFLAERSNIVAAQHQKKIDANLI